MKALIVVDVQNDFMEGGALAVPHASEIIPAVNQLIAQFELVIFTQDWHPATHKSFASNHNGKQPFEVIDLNGFPQVLWTNHCVQHTFGAEFHAELKIPHENAFIFTKGTNAEVDSYSGFYDNNKSYSTGLADFLHKKGVTDVHICGLATDYCVKFTALDAVESGFRTTVYAQATRAVNIQPDDFEKAINEMKNKGITINV